jgi:hypothetical protein
MEMTEEDKNDFEVVANRHSGLAASEDVKRLFSDSVQGADLPAKELPRLGSPSPDLTEARQCGARDNEGDLELLRRYRKGDRAAGNELVMRCQPIVLDLVKKHDKGAPFTVRFDAGNEGLVQAMNNFDLRRKKAKFRSFAWHRIRGEIINACNGRPKNTPERDWLAWWGVARYGGSEVESAYDKNLAALAGTQRMTPHLGKHRKISRMIDLLAKEKPCQPSSALSAYRRWAVTSTSVSCQPTANTTPTSQRPTRIWQAPWPIKASDIIP